MNKIERVWVDKIHVNCDSIAESQRSYFLRHVTVSACFPGEPHMPPWGGRWAGTVRGGFRTRAPPTAACCSARPVAAAWDGTCLVLLLANCVLQLQSLQQLLQIQFGVLRRMLFQFILQEEASHARPGPL